MRHRNEFVLEKMDDTLKKSVFRISAVCIAMVMVVAMAAKIFIEEIEFYPDLNMFKTIAIDPAAVINEHDKESGGNVTVSVDGYRTEDDILYVSVCGENKNNYDVAATPDIFVLSSFNKSVAEPRYHYYAENWQEILMPANSRYVCELAYSVSDINSKIQNDYIFTLTAFRNVTERGTVEIIINI